MQISPLHIVAATLAAIVVPQQGGGPVTWSHQEVPLPEAATEVRQVGDEVYVLADRWYRLSSCQETGACAEPGEPPALEVEEDGIPGGLVATGEGEGIQRAWYAEPTERYEHGALGDGVEAGALEAEDVYGSRFTVELPSSEVFEDLTPRLVDLDGDGRNEIVTIRSSLRSGSSLVVYVASGSRLIERAATPPLGQPNRWLNIAGIADFVGDGQINIAIVTTPHIGGRLEILTWNRNRLSVVDRANGFSNHVFGSTELGMSAVASVDGDRIPDLILPDADRRALRMVTASGGRIREVASVPLPAAVNTAIGVLRDTNPPSFVFGLEDGRLVAVTARQ